MAPPSLDLKEARFSNLSNAFSTAASPLRNSFSLSCRSPITPSHPSSGRPKTSYSNHGSFLKVPTPYSPNFRLGPLRGTDPYDRNYDGDDDDDDSTAVLEHTPTDETWFLPHSPGLPPCQPPSADDGKLGVLSAISIIIGKTMGVGAYSVPSAILTGVGSVGMTREFYQS